MKKRKIIKEGDLCRHCDTPTEYRTPKKRKLKKGQEYYFKKYLYCPNCSAMYMLESEKVYVNEPENNISRKKFSKEQHKLRQKKWEDFLINFYPLIKSKHATALDEKNKLCYIYLEDVRYLYYPMADKVNKQIQCEGNDWHEDGYHYLMNEVMF
jgi:hypothetical protein